MSDLGLIVDVEARINKLERGLRNANRVQTRASQQMQQRADRLADQMEQSYGRAGLSIEKTFKRLGPGLLAGLSTAAIGGAVKRLADITRGVAEIGDAAAVAGVSVERFQELKFVADQNRIGVSALTDGLKELSLRADEFITTGAGPAAEAFARLNFGADDLARRLEDPSELFLEITGRLQNLDSAAQIRVMDEIFGGSGGEQFVQLLGQGEAALRETMQRARETGQVLDADVIAKAAELDRRFTELKGKTQTLFKQMAVGAADFATQIANVSNETVQLEEVLRNAAQAGSLLGDGITQALGESEGAVEANQAEIAALLGIYEGVIAEAGNMGAALAKSARDAERMGETGLSEQLAEIAGEMQRLQGKLDDGSASAEELEGELTTLADQASIAVAELHRVDSVAFDSVLAGVGRLITRITTATAKARELRANLPGAAPDGTTDTPLDYGPRRRGGPRRQGPAVQTPDSNTIRPRAAPNNVDFGLPPVSVGGGGSTGGGGGSRSAPAARQPQQSDFERETDRIAEQTAALLQEAAAIAELTEARRGQGDALDYARTRADLMNAALQSGLTDTPALRTQIDDLATAYVSAASAADQSASKIKEIHEASRNGAQSIADVFSQMATGALSAEDAVKKLILQVVALTIKKRILAAAEGVSGIGGTFLSFLGGGFASGGYTGPGGKYQPAGVVHKGEYVLSKAATSNLGVGNLDKLHATAKRGYATGGYVGGGVKTSFAMAKPSEQAAPNVTINAPVKVEASGGTPDQNRDLAEQVASQMEGTMRSVVQDEMIRQLRPGNLLKQR